MEFKECFEECIDRIIQNNDISQMEELSEMLKESVELIQSYDEDFYNDITMRIYEMAYGKVLSKELAENIVHKMKPYGERWTIEETSQFQNQNGLDNVRTVDFYIVLNSAYNDFRNVFGDDMTNYINYVLDFIQDEDAKDGKVFLYYTTIPQ